MYPIFVTATVTDSLGNKQSVTVSAAIAPLPFLNEVGNDPTMINGSLFINKTYAVPGEVITGKHFDGARVSVTATDVTFNHCVFTGDNSANALVTCTNGAVRRAVFNHCTFRPKYLWSSTNGIAGHDFELNECLIEKVVDGCSISNSTAFAAQGAGWTTGVILKRTIIQKLARWTASATGIVHPTDSNSHNDGIQQFGGIGTEIDRCIIDCSSPALQYAHLYLRDPIGVVYTQSQAYALADNAPLLSVPMQSLANGGPYAFLGDATHPPRPLPWTSNGTGLRSRGELASPDLACIMINATQGYSAGFNVHDCYFKGGEYAINGGGNPYPGNGVNLGTWVRNIFDHSQGNQAGRGNTTHTLDFSGNWAGHITAPLIGIDANLYDNGASLTLRT